MSQEQTSQPEPQQAEAKPSLLARVFGSRIAQTIGIFGVAFTLFQGLEPFLHFARFMTFLMNHWREYTRSLWSWLGSFFHLEVPSWTLDLVSLIFFIVLFTLRVVIYGRNYKRIFGFKIDNPKDLSKSGIAVWLLRTSLEGFAMVAGNTLIGAVVVVTLYPHLGMEGAIWAALGVCSVYFVLLRIALESQKLGYSGGSVGIFVASERSIYAVAALLALNYIALHSPAIEAWFEKATRPSPTREAPASQPLAPQSFLLPLAPAEPSSFVLCFSGWFNAT